jgi:Transglycosylase SLT domain
MHSTPKQQSDDRLSLDAKARRRRMHRRHAKRRLTRVGVIAGLVFTAAIVLTPDRHPTDVAAGSSVPGAIGPVNRVPYKITASTSASHAPLFRPAGEVLNRKTTPPTVLPFATDPREIERLESLSRWHRIYTYSTKYRIKTELARKVYDAAVTAGIEPELGFRLVRVESVFKPDAVSPVGAIGLTQLMLGTARVFEPSVTREQLLDPDINLRIGFKYLRTLIREYKGNLKLALLVYNRGPTAVQNAISMGVDPTNGYESVVMRGYRGRGVLD